MLRRLLGLSKGDAPIAPIEQKPLDEVQIEANARSAILESRRQINRARSILSKEITRLDSILEKK